MLHPVCIKVSAASRFQRSRSNTYYGLLKVIYIYSGKSHIIHTNENIYKVLLYIVCTIFATIELTTALKLKLLMI